MTVAVLGLGLIGGSLVRDLSASGCRVVGGDADAATIARAREANVLERTLDMDDPASWPAALASVDVVVLALPVPAAVNVLPALAAALPADAAVTDTASTKRSIVAAAAEAGLAPMFVGAHPVAGDHRSGWSASRTGLFRDATTWICPGSASPAAVVAVESLWMRAGARIRRSDPETHDRTMAWASHLPQVVASLLGGIMGEAGIRPGDLGAGGRGATRLAASPADLWAGILLDNAPEVGPALTTMAEELMLLGQAVSHGDTDRVRGVLKRGREWAETQ